MNPAWRRYLRFFGADVDADVEEELRFHLEMRVRDYMNDGLTRDAAEAAARARFGDVEPIESALRAHDRYRERQRQWRDTMSRLGQDIRFAVRSLKGNPLFTVSAIAVLGLGIGASTAMYAVCKAVVVERLPVADQAHLIVMHPLDRGGAHLDVPYSFLKQMRRDSSVIRAVAGTYHLGAAPVPFADGDHVIALNTAAVSANFFDVLGARAVVGRLMRDADGAADEARVIVLSYAAWRREFGADPSVVGRNVIAPYTNTRMRIIGVAPPGLVYPAASEAWIPMTAALGPAQVDIVARFRGGRSRDNARAQLSALLGRVNPFEGTPMGDKVVAFSGVEVERFDRVLLGDTRAAIIILSVAVSLLFVIACVNAGSLVLMRLGDRTREVAIRRAIGASVGDLVQQLVVENVIVGAVGGLLGLGIAVTALHAVVALAPAQLPRLDSIELAGVPIGVGVMATLVAMVLFGVLPSLGAARSAPYAVLRADARAGGATHSRARGRRMLVACQVSLAIVLLAGAGLLVRTFSRLVGIDLGYSPDRVSIVWYSAPKTLVANNTQIYDLGKRLLARVESVPGVIAATPVESTPFEGQSFYIMKLGRADRPSELDHAPFVPFEFVGPDYFRTLQVPVVQGRGFRTSDTKETPGVVVVSQSFARSTWPGQDPIGMRLRNAYDTSGKAWTVVGVAHDTHFRELRNVAPVVYFDWEQTERFWRGLLAIRTAVPIGAVLPALRRAAADVSPDVTIWKTDKMEDLVEAPLAQPRLDAVLLAAFSAIALLLSGIGLYGVMASAVRGQQRELGVRIALGASSGSIRRLVLAEASRIVGIGAAVGVVVALIASRLLSSQLFGVRPTDPISMIGACLSLLGIALVAVYLPARRATRVDPVQVMRGE